jgi:hypothetical protein
VTGPDAARYLREYFAEVPGEVDYAGRWFNKLSCGGDGLAVRDRFTADDVVAVSMLSVNVSAPVSWLLLHNHAERLSDLLRQIPTDLDLWDADNSTIGPGSPADTLWYILSGYGTNGGDDGQAWVTAGKLLARKRPRLIPIYDREVRRIVALTDGSGWWLSLREALTEDLRAEITKAMKAAGIDQAISVLRALDVILWMKAKRTS